MPKSEKNSGKNNLANRRNFFQQTGVGAGLAAAWAGTASPTRAATEPGKPKPKGDRLPREVWIATISQNKLGARDTPTRIKQMLARMEEVAPLEPDIICLPEAFHLASLAGTQPPAPEVVEEPIGEISGPFAEFARKHKCYVVCPIITKHGEHYFNTAVFIDRQGELLGEYHKIYSTHSEMEMSISPGPLEPPVFQTDFGVVAAQICYDINWIESWQKLKQAGAEIVFWPSAFPGGKMVNTRAWENRFCVVSSTRKQTSKICDITGDEVARTDYWNHWVCAPVNLEKAVVNIWPGVREFKNIHAKHGRDVRIETLPEQGWAVLESRSPDVKIAEVLKEFGLKTLDENLASAEAAQCRCRP